MFDKDDKNIENDESTNNEEVVEETNNESNEKCDKNDEAHLDNDNENVGDEEENKIKELENQYKRLLAEFENFRKRTDKEKIAMFDLGATTVLGKMLPIVDNFERAVNSISDDNKDNPFVVGIDNIYKQLNKTLEDIGVKPIKALGEKFDANLHNAVMMDEESDAEEGTITEELQKGFMYKEEVLRHSMVKVKK